MPRLDTDYFDRVTEAVEAAERDTLAELVVAIEPSSGCYRDVDYLFGGLCALIGLGWVIWNPWTTHPAQMLPIEVLVAFVLGAALCARSPWLRRLLTTRRRRARQVDREAAALFCAEGVADTRGRTGVLLYLSSLERRLCVRADGGVRAAVDPERWSEAVDAMITDCAGADPRQPLLDGMRCLADLLAESLAVGDEDNPDELPNRPRVPEQG